MVVLNLGLFLAAFMFMEFVAWSNHKYIMHGFLWKWHVDHHRKDNKQYLPEKTEDKRWEKNDRFFLVYAVPAIVLLITGFSTGLWWMVSIGAGISFYGCIYFLIHDIVIHKRVNAGFGFITKTRYFQALIRAHTAHHQPKTKDDFNNFGLLIFPHRFFNS